MTDAAASREVRAAIEAVVLAAVEPVEPQLLAQLLEMPVADVEAACDAMAEAYDITLEYLKTRKQFGATIGSFQALQHRAVDMLVSVEQARSMAYYATMMADNANAEERRNAIAAAMVQIRRSARHVCQQAVQLHGGIGMTIEYKVGHYFKRITALESLFGDLDHHLAVVSKAGRV